MSETRARRSKSARARPSRGPKRKRHPKTAKVAEARKSPRRKSAAGSFLFSSPGTGRVQNRILEMIARGESLALILDTLTRLIEQYAPPAVCLLSLLKQKNKMLHPGSAPSLPAAYVKQFERLKIGLKSGTAGTAGTAAHKNQIILVKNITRDRRFEKLRDPTLKLGFQVCCCAPIHDSRGRVLGTLCLFFTESRDPSPEEREILNTASHLAGVAVERQRAEEEVRKVHARLEEQVKERSQDMTEAIRQLQDEIVRRKIIERSLKKSNEKLQILTSHQESVREEERARISREIHDELGQILTTLKMEISLLDERRQEENLPIEEDLKSMTRLVETTLQTVRRISTELRPGILDVLGLAEALEWQAQEFQKRAHIQIQTDIQRLPEVAEKRFSTACFRICQEALTNVARHAQATRVILSLKRKNGRLELRVQDNGRGITSKQSSGLTSLGLIGMRERAQNLGGKLEIKGRSKKGTSVCVSFPLELRA